MYIYASSTDSKKYYENNYFYEFTVELPKSLPTGNSELALTHAFYTSRVFRDHYCYLLCDAVEPSILRDELAPVVGTFCNPGAVECVQYHKVKTSTLKRISFLVRPCDSIRKEVGDDVLYLTLHLRTK